MKRAATFVLLVTLSAFAGAEHDNTNFNFNAADEHYGADKMAAARKALRHEHGAMPHFFVMTDRLEYRSGSDEDGLTWDAQGWYGGDIDKVWVKTEGEYSETDSAFEDAELEVLWSRAISPFFDFQLGLRHDFEPDGLSHAVIGLHGLAPYWFEIDAAAYLSEDGDLTTAFEAEYEWLFTQRLVLQWRGELQAAFGDIPERQLGAGLTSVDTGLRLRYEVAREFAPYVGVEYSRSLGQTADLVEAAGSDNDDFSVIAGVRFWF